MERTEMKCSNGHKPPVPALWKVGGVVLCTGCMKRAAKKGMNAALVALKYSTRRSTKEMLYRHSQRA